MNESYQAILKLIESVRLKRRRLRLTRILLVLLALALILLAGSALIPGLQGLPRLALRLFIIVSLALFGAGALFAALYKREGHESAALAIERVNPRLHNALINALQLARAVKGSGPASAFSPVFLEKHLEATAAILPGLDLEKAAPGSMLKRPALMLGAAMAVALLALGLFPGRLGRGLSALFSEGWSVQEARREAAALPLTAGDFTIAYAFPAYSGIQAQTITHGSGDLAALKGTSVTLETTVLEPLQNASLVTSHGARYAMSITDETTLKAELVLSEPGTYFIEGEGKDGARRAEPRSHRMVVDPDLKPQAVMLSPVEDVQVPAEGSLHVSYEATDDFGVREVALVYQSEGQEHKLVIRTEGGEARKRVQGDYEWLISEMHFQAGQRIPFYVQVTDNDEVAGGQIGRSETRVVEIFSALSEHRKLLARQDELFNLMIDHLAAHLEAAFSDQDGKSDPVASEKALLEQGSKMLAAITDLHLALLDDELADQMVLDTLLDMENRYSGLLENRAQLIEGAGPLPEPRRNSLLTLRRQYQDGLEKDILYFDKLIKKQRVEDVLAQANDLYKAQADLADLFAQYKKTGDPALLEKLRQAMSQLQEAFANLMQRMAQMRKDLPEEFVNADAMKKMNVSGLSEQMEKLRQALADGDLENASALAEQFLSQMGQWMAAMEEGAGQFGDMMSSQTMQKLGEASDQLADLIKRQQALENDLAQMNQEFMDRAQAEGPKSEDFSGLDEKINKLFQSLQQAQLRMYQMTPMDADGKPTPRDLGQEKIKAGRRFAMLGQEAMDLKSSVQDRELSEALNKARRIEEEFESARGDADKIVKDSNAGPPELRQSYESSVKDSAQLAKDIIQDLEKLGRPAPPRLNDADKAKLDQMSRLQEALKDDTQSVLSDYEALRQETPSLPGKVSEHLQNGALSMHDAAGEMMLGDPARSLVPARDARGHLEKAQSLLQEAQKQMAKEMMLGGASAMMMGGQGRNPGMSGMLNGKVKLPDEGAYKVPEKYREEILKAMKEDAPDAYKNLNHDYYERLVR